MPIHYRIDPTQRLLITTMVSPYTLDDMRQHLTRLLADPAYEPGFSALIDRRGVDEVATPAEVYAYVDVIRSHAKQLGPARWAIVVNRVASYGMGRMSSILLDPVGISLEVYMTMEEACAALGVTVLPDTERSA